METECKNILDFWIAHAVDANHGGFIGKMDNNGQIDTLALKGLVLNARILWTFAGNHLCHDSVAYDIYSKRSFRVLSNDFYDRINNGYFWSVNFQNEPISTRKQVYGQAFVVYAFSAYFKINPQPEILSKALDLYFLIEKHAFDPMLNGYTEAFAADWSPLDDMRLSPKDLNTPKSLNTHLHILEAYVQLYKVWKDELLMQKIKNLIDLFLKYFIDYQAGHVHMFFDDAWQVIASPWSYGHDIETSWLLYEASEVVNHRIEEVKVAAIVLADNVLPVIDQDGGVAYESHLNQKHWWVQAEAMVGFMNAYQMTDDEKYLEAVYRIWDYTKKYIKDTVNGEWYWGRNADGSVMETEDKIGFWKCPYHNVRACTQMSTRIKALINQKQNMYEMS
jgi:mannobiose 2-epimerase